jgi:hypothetical protein
MQRFECSCAKGLRRFIATVWSSNVVLKPSETFQCLNKKLLKFGMATDRSATEWYSKRQTSQDSRQISHCARRGGKCLQVLQFMGIPWCNMPDQPIKIKVPSGYGDWCQPGKSFNDFLKICCIPSFQHPPHAPHSNRWSIQKNKRVISTLSRELFKHNSWCKYILHLLQCNTPVKTYLLAGKF